MYREFFSKLKSLAGITVMNNNTMSIRKKYLLLLLILVLPLMTSSAKTLNQYLPKAVNGWVTVGEDHYYNPETLFDYINGGAELFISYDFEQVISRTYKKSGQPDITIEIFDMVKAKNAFGVFTHAREDVYSNFGQGSQTFEGAILFWKDRYYISIVSDVETNDSKKTLVAMAKKIDKAIKQTGMLPEILDWIPESLLVPGSVFYFHHYVWLNAFYYISDENLLNITDKTDAVLAKYGEPEKRYYLLIIQYPDNNLAGVAYKNFAEQYAPEIKTHPVVKLEDGKWIACKVDHDLFVCVFNAHEEKNAGTLLKTVLEKHSSSGE